MTGFHYEYGASSAKRWTSCLASIRTCADCPPGADSEWGIEGRIAHDLAEECLLAGKRADLVAGRPEITDDMVRAVNVYLDYIYAILRAFPGSILRVENRVEMPSAVVPGRIGGTFDARIYVPSHAWLIVFDYKHGAGIYVDEEDNLQMQMYSIGALFEMSDPVARVTNVIVQPRAIQAGGQIRETDVPIADLLRRHAWFDRKAAETLRPDAPFAPTPENCRWCPAAGYGKCLVVNQEVAKALTPGAVTLNALTQRSLPDPAKMSIEQMSVVVANAKLIRAFLKNVESTVTSLLMRNVAFPGFKLVQSMAEREWFVDYETEVVPALGALLGWNIDEAMPRKPLGVVEVENALIDFFRGAVTQAPGEYATQTRQRRNNASKLARETMALWTVKAPRGRPTLAPLSDPRPAIETSVPFIAGQINTEGL